MENWAPTIVTLIATAGMSVVGYLYVSAQGSKDVQIRALLASNSEVAKGLHELSSAVQLLKQSLNYMTEGADARHCHILSQLEKHDTLIDKLESNFYALAENVSVIRIKWELKSTQ